MKAHRKPADLIRAAFSVSIIATLAGKALSQSGTLDTPRVVTISLVTLVIFVLFPTALPPGTPDLARRIRPGAMLMDIRMPGGTGAKGAGNGS
jgi:hypothetical protein